MRGWLFLLAATALCAFSGPASAQARLDCATAPASVCASDEVLALEGERLALTEQLAAADPQHAALAGEQAWIDGLGACGEDVECYRTAYLNHNQTLRQSTATLPGAMSEPSLEEPPDAATVEPAAESDEAAPAPVRDEPRERGGAAAYVASGLPGWGFFTAIGVTLLILFWLLRARARHRRAADAEEARLRDDWG